MLPAPQVEYLKTVHFQSNMIGGFRFGMTYGVENCSQKSQGHCVIAGSICSGLRNCQCQSRCWSTATLAMLVVGHRWLQNCDEQKVKSQPHTVERQLFVDCHTDRFEYVEMWQCCAKSVCLTPQLLTYQTSQTVLGEIHVKPPKVNHSR